MSILDGFQRLLWIENKQMRVHIHGNHHNIPNSFLMSCTQVGHRPCLQRWGCGAHLEIAGCNPFSLDRMYHARLGMEEAEVDDIDEDKHEREH